MQLVRLLLEEGADAAARDSDGNTALVACVQGNGYDDGESEELIQLRRECAHALRSAGCPLSPDAFGATVAENAVSRVTHHAPLLRVCDSRM